MTPTLKGFDHAHVYVADRAAAVKWYANVMDMTPIPEFLSWAEGGGPLTLTDPTDTIHLAIFERECFEPGTHIAFGASGAQWLQWKTHLESKSLTVRADDHVMAYSLYFRDPDENMYEITTYEPEVVRAAMS